MMGSRASSRWFALAVAALLAGPPLTAAELGVAELAAHLVSERPAERLAAFLGLAQIHSPAAAAAALAGGRTHARLSSAELEAFALALGGADIQQSLIALSAAEPAVVEAAIRDLGRRPPDLLKPLLAGLQADAAGAALVRRILEVSMRVTDPSPAHEALVLMQFEAPEEQRRIAAVVALQGGQGLDAGTAQHIARDSSAQVRAALVPVLKSLLNHSGLVDNPVQAWTRDLLIALAGDDAASVRAPALEALEDCWPMRAQGGSTKRELALFMAALADPDPIVLYHAIRFFSIHHEEAAVAQIEKLCSDPRGVTASIALDAVRGMGLPSLAQLAFQACSLPAPQDRWVALEILQELRDPRLPQVAARLLDDPDYNVRSTAQRAIAQGAPGSEGAGLALATASKLRPSERLGLLVRLAQLDPPERLAEVAKVYQGMTPEQRSELMGALEHDGRLAASLGGFLELRALDADPASACAAFAALRGGNGRSGHLGLAEAVARMDDADPHVAQAARACASAALGQDAFTGSALIHHLNPQWYDGGDGPQPKADVAALCAAATAAPAAEKAARFALLAGCDDELAARTLEGGGAQPRPHHALGGPRCAGAAGRPRRCHPRFRLGAPAHQPRGRSPGPLPLAGPDAAPAAAPRDILRHRRQGGARPRGRRDRAPARHPRPPGAGAMRRPSAPPRALAALCAAVCALLQPPGAVAADTVALPAPEQLIANLRGPDAALAEVAEGQQNLPPPTSFPALLAGVAQRSTQAPARLEIAICRALVLRGYRPAVKSCAQASLRGGADTNAWRLTTEQLRSGATAEELLPLAHELSVQLASTRQPIAYQGNELWVILAGQTGEPALLQDALALASSPQGRTARSAMAGRFDPDRCAAALLPPLAPGLADDRLLNLRLLGRGWRSGPARAQAALMKDPDPEIRRAFALTLDGSASDSALELALHGLGDPDPMVRSYCLGALGSFHGTTQAPLLRTIANDAKGDVALRCQAWSLLDRLPGNVRTPAAKALAGSGTAERPLRDAAIAYLLQRQEVRWLLDELPRMSGAAKADALAALARTGSVAVLAALPPFLRAAEPALVAEVMRALASIRDPAVLPLLIGHLEDANAEVRSACMASLSTATGLSYHPHRGVRTDAAGVAEAAAAEIKAIHSGWARWYDLFAAPPGALLEADLVVARAALRGRSEADRSPLQGLAGPAYPVLLRLAGDANLGAKALNLLGELQDPRLAKDLLAQIEGPGLANRSSEVALVLMRSPPDPGVLPQLSTFLEWPDTVNLAIKVLLAWRVPSPALTTAILERRQWGLNVVPELASWKDCPVMATARKLVADAKADEHQRSLALALLVEVGDEREVKMLGQVLQDGGVDYQGAMRALVRMAAAGVESASQELARFLIAATRKPSAKPGQPRTGDDQKARLDLSPQVIAGLTEYVIHPDPAPGAVLPRPLLAAIGAWTRAATSVDQQCAGITLLLALNDAGAGELLPALLAASDGSSAKRFCDAVLAIRHPEARPCVDLLLSMPGLDDQIIARITSWYREVAKLKEEELARVMAALQASQDAQGGQPVRGLALSMELSGSTAPLGAKGLKAKVTIRNLGKKAWSCFPEQLQFLIHVRCVEGQQGEFLRDLRLEFKSKMRATGNGTEPTVLEPGQSFSAMAAFEAPGEGFASSGHRVRLTWRVPETLGVSDGGVGATGATVWRDFSFIPPLWEEIDRRTLAAGR